MKTTLITGMLILGLPTAALADNPAGYDLAKKAHDLTAGYIGAKSDAIMTLFEGDKKTVEYKLTQFATESSAENNNTTKSLIRFLAPADSKGTALLTHEEKGGAESRWLYMSETRQTKQIAGSAKSASFKGSELSYEDLATDVLDKYTYKTLGEKKAGDRPCWEVERTAKYEDTGYSKSVVCFDKAEGYPLEIKFFDKAGKLLKETTLGDYKKVDGQWRSHLSEIKNVQTNKRTTMRVGNFKLKQKLSDQMFTVAQLAKD